VYGWVLDAAWGLAGAGRRLHGETWRAMCGLADFVARNWRRPDAGIWEVRGEQRHYVHSKLMGWLTLDRAVALADTHRTSGRRVRRWSAQQRALADEIRAKGFDPQRGCYVRSYGSPELDGALLLLPSLGFEEPGSPRLEATVAAIQRELHAGGPLLYRYRPANQGTERTEGAFLACSFWLVDALARLGHREEAGSLFEDLCKRSNVLGLFAEEMDPLTGEHLGNFPQGLTHAALLQAAMALEGEGDLRPRS
jgi:GH15 family glucan-1,4-alpha-glucosidase